MVPGTCQYGTSMVLVLLLLVLSGRTRLSLFVFCSWLFFEESSKYRSYLKKRDGFIPFKIIPTKRGSESEIQPLYPLASIILSFA